MRFFMKHTAILFLIVFSFFSFNLMAQEIPPPTSGPREEPIPEEAQQQKWTAAFQDAEKAFNSDTPESSIPLFQNLVTEISDQKNQRQLSQSELSLLWRSLDYLGQAYFNDGQVDPARSVFVKLI